MQQHIVAVILAGLLRQERVDQWCHDRQIAEVAHLPGCPNTPPSSASAPAQHGGPEQSVVRGAVRDGGTKLHPASFEAETSAEPQGEALHSIYSGYIAEGPGCYSLGRQTAKHAIACDAFDFVPKSLHVLPAHRLSHVRDRLRQGFAP